MTKGHNDNRLSSNKGEPHVDEGAVNITKTTDIYCGRPTAGYQVVRVGLDITFTPDLDKVHALIEEYYNGQTP